MNAAQRLRQTIDNMKTNSLVASSSVGNVLNQWITELDGIHTMLSENKKPDESDDGYCTIRIRSSDLQKLVEPTKTKQKVELDNHFHEEEKTIQTSVQWARKKHLIKVGNLYRFTSDHRLSHYDEPKEKGSRLKSRLLGLWMVVSIGGDFGTPGKNGTVLLRNQDRSKLPGVRTITTYVQNLEKFSPVNK